MSEIAALQLQTMLLLAVGVLLWIVCGAFGKLQVAQVGGGGGVCGVGGGNKVGECLSKWDRRGVEMAGIAARTFSWGGPGAVLVQLVLLAACGYLLSTLARTVGKGQIAAFIDLLNVLTCISLVAANIWTALNSIAKVMNIR